MAQMIEVLPSNIRLDQLEKELSEFLGKHNFWDERQVSLTSVTGENDWFCSIGSMLDLPMPEKAYSVINKDLQGTYIAELIQEYKKFYRWRILNIPPGQFYSVHTDAFPEKINKRIHIPVLSNDKAFFCYYEDKPADGVETKVQFHYLQPGKVYEVNTSRLHSAINYGVEPRYHLVGVRYEK